MVHTVMKFLTDMYFASQNAFQKNEGGMETVFLRSSEMKLLVNKKG